MARTLYQKPDLLLLDEATSAMDRETEQEILRLLMNINDQMGIILVTHHVQSVKLADQIYILKEGIITEKGTPDELAMQNNLFSRSLADITVT